jgi:DNA-binding MarR family transcriptional regulator
MKTKAFVHRNLPRLLLQAREAVMTHTRPSLREHGLSDQQWRVLRVLGENAHCAEGVETGRVAREAFLLGPSLTGVLTRMARDGLIERRRCPESELGKQKLAQLYQLLDAVIQLETLSTELNSEEMASPCKTI